MNLPFYIARRYLFAKKSHNAVNIISAVSVCGIVVATVAMVCTLSVFNGFKDLTETLFSVFDPELKITPIEGKVFDPTTPEMQAVRTLPEISLCSEVLQENALVRYNERQEISVLKGVDDRYHDLATIDTAIIDGQYILQDGDVTYTVMGIGLAASLGVNAGFAMPLEIYVPKRDENVNLANPASLFKVEYASVGGVYHINQPVYDEGFMLLPLSMLRALLNYEKEVSALELRLTSGANISSVKKKITRLTGGKYLVQDRYEQQETSYKMVSIEKWVSFLMLCFILVMALFNLVGSLSILMIEKEDDAGNLRSMGADNNLINRIFVSEGRMIAFSGALLGVIIGLLLCWIQKRFGVISLGQTEGTFIIDSYPVKVEWDDILLIFITVVTIGFLAAWYPVHFLGKKWLGKGVAAVLLLPLLVTGCGGGERKRGSNVANNNRILEIAVTIEPERYFAERIAGDGYNIFSVVPVGQSPETYDLTPREMVRIGKSRAYFRIGNIGFEEMLTDAMQKNNPQLRFFNLSDGMTMIKNEEHDSHHGHGGIDPHIWTSFGGARCISKNILDAMTELNSAHRADYVARYATLEAEIATLERQIHIQLDTLSHRTFVIYHPALTYFAAEFGLTQLSIENEGKEPSPATIKKLIGQARDANVRVVFVQQEFDTKNAEQIASEIGARVVRINPLDYDWQKQIKTIADALYR